MIPSNPIPQVCNYGSSASYCTCPSDEQIANGVVPLDSLPASWWNWLWSKTNTAVNCARYAAGVLIDEVNTVLTQAGVCVNPSCVDQLYRAINNIRQTIGTAEVAGAVKSSSTASEVAIDPATGKMSVNCLGNAASLTTTATTVVGAINELKSTYDSCISALNTAIGGKAAVGNAAGCALGTASAGTSTTAARSDHVHPVPTCVPYAVTGGYLGERAALGCAPTCTYGIANIWNYCNDSRYYLIGTKYDNAACKYNVRVDYATYACSATSAGSAASATNAACAARVSVESCTGVNNETLPIPLVYTSDPGCTGNYNLVMAGINSLRYNPYSGLMYLKSCFKTACIGHMNASYLHIYTDAPEIAFNKSIYLPDGCYICRAKYACCASYNGAGTAFGTAATCAATAFRSNTWYPDNKSCGCVKYACCASYDGGGNAFGTAARYNYEAFRPSTWYPNDITQGCVKQAQCATTAVKASRGESYCWLGRSNVDCAGVWCACFQGSCNGQLQICNCSGGILIYSIKNATRSQACLVYPHGRGDIICCMCNGSSAAHVWMIL